MYILLYQNDILLIYYVFHTIPATLKKEKEKKKTLKHAEKKSPTREPKTQTCTKWIPSPIPTLKSPSPSIPLHGPASPLLTPKFTNVNTPFIFLPHECIWIVNRSQGFFFLPPRMTRKMPSSSAPFYVSTDRLATKPANKRREETALVDRNLSTSYMNKQLQFHHSPRGGTLSLFLILALNRQWGQLAQAYNPLQTEHPFCPLIQNKQGRSQLETVIQRKENSLG